MGWSWSMSHEWPWIILKRKYHVIDIVHGEEIWRINLFCSWWSLAIWSMSKYCQWHIQPFLLTIETQNLSCWRSFSVKALDLFTNRCSKMALIRDEKDKYLCSETETISLISLELSLFLKSLVTSYQIHTKFIYIKVVKLW